MAEGEQQQQQQQQEEQTPKWVEELKASFGQVGTGINTLVELAKASGSKREEPKKEEEVDTGEDLLEDQQLELMPRAAFAQRLMQSFEQSLDGKLAPLVEQIQSQGQNILRDHYVREAEKFAAKTKDFAEWSDEMQEIAKDNPNLPISRIYAIARSENPTKAAEMSKKYADSEEQPRTQQRKAPLSMSTSGTGGDVRNTRMKPEDAAKAAWEDSVAKFGNVFEGR